MRPRARRHCSRSRAISPRRRDRPRSQSASPSAPAADPLEPDTSVWLQNARGRRARAACRASRADRPGAHRRPAEHLEPWLDRSEPYIVDASDYAALGPRARGHRRLLRDRPVHRRRTLGRRRRRDRRPRHNEDRELELLGSIARQTARAADAASYEPRAHVLLHRRGSRERARGERRAHVDARALDHRPRAAVGEELGLEPRGAQAPRARRALPRHREDRDPRRGSSPRPAR